MKTMVVIMYPASYINIIEAARLLWGKLGQNREDPERGLRGTIAVQRPGFYWVLIGIVLVPGMANATLIPRHGERCLMFRKTADRMAGFVAREN